MRSAVCLEKLGGCLSSARAGRHSPRSYIAKCRICDAFVPTTRVTSRNGNANAQCGQQCDGNWNARTTKLTALPADADGRRARVTAPRPVIAYSASSSNSSTAYKNINQTGARHRIRLRSDRKPFSEISRESHGKANVTLHQMRKTSRLMQSAVLCC
eukprot:2292079-Prymnesium_polylepis.2